MQTVSPVPNAGRAESLHRMEIPCSANIADTTIPWRIKALPNESDFFVAMATAKGHRKATDTLIFHCNGCGAEFVLAPGVISASCAYCDSPHVVRLDQFRELLEPDGILPHTLTQKQAIEKLVFWVDLYEIKPERKVDIPRPIYLPLWTFDLGGGIDYSGETIQTETDGFRQVATRGARPRPISCACQRLSRARQPQNCPSRHPHPADL